MSFLKSIKLKFKKIIEKNSSIDLEEKDNDYNDWLETSVDNGSIKYFEYSGFENVQPIGRGTFGSVVRANLKNTDDFFALKSFNNEETALYKIAREVYV